MMKKYTVYRIPNSSFIAYKPVIRNGKPISFNTRKEAEEWLQKNPPKTVSGATFEVRRTIKYVADR